MCLQPHIQSAFIEKWNKNIKVMMKYDGLFQELLEVLNSNLG